MMMLLMMAAMFMIIIMLFAAAFELAKLVNLKSLQRTALFAS